MTTVNDSERSILLDRDDGAMNYDSVRKFVAEAKDDPRAAAEAMLVKLTESDAKGCGGPGDAGRQEVGSRARCARPVEVRRREWGRERAGDLQGQGPDGAFPLAGCRGGNSQRR